MFAGSIDKCLTRASKRRRRIPPAKHRDVRLRILKSAADSLNLGRVVRVDIFAEFDRAEAALERPTLRLLRGEWASFALSVFRTCFSQEDKQVECERMHLHVDGIRRDFLEAGRPVPSADGRAQCRLWREQRWLQRVSGDGDEQFYELTSSALEAISLVDTLSSDRPLISESRIKTIMDRIRVCALQASDDPSERVARLGDEINRLTYELARVETERERIRAGGPVMSIDNHQMREEYDNVNALLAQLPRDFQRIEESLGTLRREIIADFQAETRSKGEILGSYVERTDNLLLETAEGKAFDGALSILQDDGAMRDLDTQLAAIIAHPFAGELFDFGPTGLPRTRLTPAPFRHSSGADPAVAIGSHAQGIRPESGKRDPRARAARVPRGAQPGARWVDAVSAPARRPCAAESNPPGPGSRLPEVELL